MNPRGLEGGRGQPCRLNTAVSQPTVVVVVVEMGQDKVLLSPQELPKGCLQGHFILFFLKKFQSLPN